MIQNMARIGLLSATLLFCVPTSAIQLTLNGPSGSQNFGSAVAVLPNGNFLVTDPQYDSSTGTQDVGAVFLYRPDGTLISTLTGSNTGDQVGRNGVVVLATGNFVVLSSAWNQIGAVTFGLGDAGVNGTVSAENSLVGTEGLRRVVALPNGNYLVESFIWPANQAFGAVTWGSGITGVKGEISESNSLVGNSDGDSVGQTETIVLPNSNYLVRTPRWHNGSATDAGAVTFGSGSQGIVGKISAENSLVGSTVDDNVGGSIPVILTNGNFVLTAPFWANGQAYNAGAVTLGSGINGKGSDFGKQLADRQPV